MRPSARKPGHAGDVAVRRSESRENGSGPAVDQPGLGKGEEPFAGPIPCEEQAAALALERARPGQPLRRDVELQDLEMRLSLSRVRLPIDAEPVVAVEKAADARAFGVDAGRGESPASGEVVNRQESVPERGQARPVGREREERRIAREKNPRRHRLAVRVRIGSSSDIERTSSGPPWDRGPTHAACLPSREMAGRIHSTTFARSKRPLAVS